MGVIAQHRETLEIKGRPTFDAVLCHFETESWLLVISFMKV
jgi:hypothetical protein